VTGAGDAAGPAPTDVLGVELVEDRTAGSRADEGFLRVRRLLLRNVRRDGTRSAPYPCDVVSRTRTDAVAVALFEVREGPSGTRVPWVLLKAGVRPPVWLRRGLALTQPDERVYGLVPEVVAGMIEPSDAGPRGIERRAVEEAKEEAGVRLAKDEIAPLGAPAFPSPGITDEKVHFRAGRADLRARGAATGDGSPMEEGGNVLVLRLDDAIAACRRGEVPDMKTEIALLRLADAIRWVPQLSRFVDDLPADLAKAWRPLGLPEDRR
jgi:ADP-ribose pyrophosphatase